MGPRASRVARAALTIACALPVGAAALRADTLSGTVRDASGRPVPGADIRIDRFDGASAYRVRSDQAGAYSVPALVPGSYWLVAHARPFLLSSTERIQVEGNTVHDVELALAPLEDSITVVGNALPASAADSAKSVAAVDGGDYRKRIEPSLVEGLRAIAGVRVQRLRTPGSGATVQFRGLRSHDTAVLIDGLRFRDASSVSGEATPFLSDMAYFDTERVEVQRGASSTLYGSHAVGGVIDIRSSRGGGPAHAEISAEAGGLGSARGLVRIGGGLGPVQRLIYSGGGSHRNVTRGVDGFDPYRNTGGQGYARFTLAPALTLSGRIFGTDSFLAINESPSVPDAVLANLGGKLAVPAVALPPHEVRAYEAGREIRAGDATFVPDFNDPDARRAASFYAAAIILRHQISPDRSLRASYQQVRTKRRFGDGPGGVGAFEPPFSTAARYTGRIDTLQVRADLASGPRQTLTAGYEFERERYEDRHSNGAPDAARLDLTESSAQQSSHAAFVQDSLRWKSLQVTVAGRYQVFRLSGPSFTGGSNPYGLTAADPLGGAFTADLSLAYFARDSNTKLRAHARSGYRAPAPFERYGASFFLGTASFWGAPSLSPERSVSYEAGFDQWLARGKARASATAYYAGVRDVVTFDFGVIDPATDPWGRSGGYRNGVGLLSRGIEVDLSASPTRSTTLRAAYTYVNSDSKAPTVPGTDFHKALGVSDHMFGLSAIQAIGKRLELALDWSAMTSYPLRFFRAPGWQVFPGPLKVDAACTYRVPLEGARGIDIFVMVENILNRQYYEDGQAAPRAWAVGGLRFRF